MGVCFTESCIHNELFAAAAMPQNCVFLNGHMVEKCFFCMMPSGELLIKREDKIKQTFFSVVSEEEFFLLDLFICAGLVTFSPPIS